jgi:hypothetical protein
MGDGRGRPQADQGRVQHAPVRFPLRILLATNAATEGIDLQRYCHRMVHVEIPFSPTRLEQRNGRIDRHGQPAPEVLIHHFVGDAWERAPAGKMDADLGFLSLVARKVETIRDDLGTVGPVLAQEVERKMLGLPADIDRRPPRTGPGPVVHSTVWSATYARRSAAFEPSSTPASTS